ncbi:histidinol dehydrogenase [Batrachochytrium salamandrivorans]|nr:histidinol dehydrogenase [Batrachochytrium salamandrivorans]
MKPGTCPRRLCIGKPHCKTGWCDIEQEDLVERAPFDPAKMVISPQVKAAIDLAFDNIWTFIKHKMDNVPLVVETMPAVLPSTALMLGIPAKVAGCSEIVIALRPQGRYDLTRDHMVAQCDSSALVAIDMPAGPSELLIVADTHSDIRYVVSDLLSQAEHGADSQVVLVAVGFEQHHVDALQIELKKQAMALPRSAIVQLALEKSYVLTVDSMDDALSFSNKYAPEHLILNVENPGLLVDKVKSAGSVFLGAYSPESCGDYASGTNHTLPTYGFARMYSGVNTHTFLKHITTQELSRDGLDGLGDCVVTLAALEQLEAHRNAVAIRLADIRGKPV